ncbi:Protein kinase-like domain protein [Niveomyces insectorum RCEF 264]|uniref:Protein kinase-like domain protein n=1 Tax=Niveomyces insectorum RCEF 264 TaxID=1081102 RepID=A0A168AD53_9HYPO|nr:Protein kinase-like domain protein [Niveomyces insectorum RCEF 264]
MSSNKPSGSQQRRQNQQQISVEQERQVLDWIAKETASGTVVRKPLIQWFAERVVQRDGAQDVALAPEFAQIFLDRHPDLAKTLVVPPSPPSPEERPDAETTKVPLRGIARLREMRRQDARRALYGDSPPPPRQPAPYPEGDLIYHCNNRYVVRHGDFVTKYTTSGDGMGAREHPNEAVAMRFVQANTTIPVPAVIRSDWDRITMEYVEGQTLRQAWAVLTPGERATIMDQLRGYVAQLQALAGTQLGRLDGQGVVLPSIIPRSGGPFSTMAAFHTWLVQPPKRLPTESMYWHQITTQLGSSYPIVFTHGDIAARNIMVRDGRIVALLDWEFAGWYPAYWDYVFALRGLDNIDWETLGCHIPSLFPKRYDLEYILIKFIMSIS